jgi:hypothetical protein
MQIRYFHRRSKPHSAWHLSRWSNRICRFPQSCICNRTRRCPWSTFVYLWIPSSLHSVNENCDSNQWIPYRKTNQSSHGSGNKHGYWMPSFGEVSNRGLPRGSNESQMAFNFAISFLWWSKKWTFAVDCLESINRNWMYMVSANQSHSQSCYQLPIGAKHR